jgi:hypothetical protein
MLGLLLVVAVLGQDGGSPCTSRPLRSFDWHRCLTDTALSRERRLEVLGEIAASKGEPELVRWELGVAALDPELELRTQAAKLLGLKSPLPAISELRTALARQAGARFPKELAERAECSAQSDLKAVCRGSRCAGDCQHQSGEAHLSFAGGRWKLLDASSHAIDDGACGCCQ